MTVTDPKILEDIGNSGLSPEKRIGIKQVLTALCVAILPGGILAVTAYLTYKRFKKRE